jgi:sec-independent protein translocase protein TatA
MNSLYFPVAAFGLGGGELLVILCIALLLFGGKKLPDLAKGLGKSIREFKKAAAEGEEEPADASDKKVTAKPESSKTHGAN